MGRENESLYKLSMSHDQNGHKAHKWGKTYKNILKVGMLPSLSEEHCNIIYVQNLQEMTKLRRFMFKKNGPKGFVCPCRLLHVYDHYFLTTSLKPLSQSKPNFGPPPIEA